mmetsp:Transcript_11814/g.28038  ORF Transcript_11814/g.28038 Transcript_11814/m.28038 type:complete len:495 (+) Transcript_11814:270-1754(+)
MFHSPYGLPRLPRDSRVAEACRHQSSHRHPAVEDVWVSVRPFLPVAADGLLNQGLHLVGELELRCPGVGEVAPHLLDVAHREGGVQRIGVPHRGRRREGHLRGPGVPEDGAPLGDDDHREVGLHGDLVELEVVLQLLAPHKALDRLHVGDALLLQLPGAEGALVEEEVRARCELQRRLDEPVRAVVLPRHQRHPVESLDGDRQRRRPRHELPQHGEHRLRGLREVCRCARCLGPPGDVEGGAADHHAVPAGNNPRQEMQERVLGSEAVVAKHSAEDPHRLLPQLRQRRGRRRNPRAGVEGGRRRGGRDEERVEPRDPAGRRVGRELVILGLAREAELRDLGRMAQHPDDLYNVVEEDARAAVVHLNEARQRLAGRRGQPPPRSLGTGGAAALAVASALLGEAAEGGGRVCEGRRRSRALELGIHGHGGDHCAALGLGRLVLTPALGVTGALPGALTRGLLRLCRHNVPAEPLRLARDRDTVEGAALPHLGLCIL